MLPMLPIPPWQQAEWPPPKASRPAGATPDSEIHWMSDGVPAFRMFAAPAIFAGAALI